MSEAVSSPIGASRLPAILWLTFTLFIVYGGSIPFHFTADRAQVADKLSRLRLNPLISPDTGRRASIPDVVQNIALFIPFGALGVIALRQQRSELTAIIGTTALAAVLSAAVETMQLFELESNDVRVRLLRECRGSAVWRDGRGGTHQEFESGSTPAAGAKADGGATVLSAPGRRDRASCGGLGAIRFHARRRHAGRQGSSAPGRSVAIRLGEGRGRRVGALRPVRPGCVALATADRRAQFYDIGGGRRRDGGRRPRSKPVDHRVPDARLGRCGRPCGRRRRRRCAFTTVAVEPLADLLVRRAVVRDRPGRRAAVA